MTERCRINRIRPILEPVPRMRPVHQSRCSFLIGSLLFQAMSPLSSAPRFQLVFVLGHNHSGSTLLGKCLDRHPKVLCVGEMMRIGSALKNPNARFCSCGELLTACPFWKPRLPILGRVGYNSWLIRSGTFRRILSSTDREVLVETSKGKAWYRLRFWRKKNLGFILLVRDSRGIVCSKKRVGKTVESCIRSIHKWMKRFVRFFETSSDRVLLVYYEDLIADLEGQMRRIAAFLNLEFVPEMLLPEEQVHHFIFSSTSKYLKGTGKMVLDERWRRELTPGEIRQVESMMERVPVLRDKYIPKGAGV